MGLRTTRSTDHLAQSLHQAQSIFRARLQTRNWRSFATLGVALLWTLVLQSCERHLTSSEREHVELVMRPGMTITATTPIGKIVVRADSELRRTYVFDSTSISEVLIPRQERYVWDLGIPIESANPHRATCCMAAASSAVALGC